MLNIELNLEYTLTIISTIFMLGAFARLIFSLGEHITEIKTVPVITVIFLCKIFILGFILFNVYNHISILNSLKREIEINSKIIICLFGLKIIFESIIINKQLAIVDKYLYSDLDKCFDKFWRRSYNTIFLPKNKILIYTNNACHIILSAVVIKMLFIDITMNEGFFFIMFVFYTVLYVMINSYFSYIGTPKVVKIQH